MEINNKKIYDLIIELGIALTDHKHIWSNDLRRRFEKITSYLSADLNNSYRKEID